MSTNPFMDKPANPFMEIEKPPSTAAVLLPPCGDPTCNRSHRPSGQHYSVDRAQRTRELQEDGKMGPQFGALGGARAKSRRRATEIVAEAAAEHAEKIKKVFLDGIDESNPIGVRLKAANDFLAVEDKEHARLLAERQAEFDAMNKDQLVDSISEMLSKLANAGAIASEIEEMMGGGEIVDADVVDD